MKCILINNFINFTKSARTNVTTQDIKIQLTSIKYFTNIGKLAMINSPLLMYINFTNF